MVTVLSKKPILRTVLLLLALLATLALALIFRPKSSLYAIVDLAKHHRPDGATLTTAVISAATKTQKADVVYSTATTPDEALDKAVAQVTASSRYTDYEYYRLDLAYGPAAANPTRLVDSLPLIGDHTYYADADTYARKLSADPGDLTDKQLSDLIHKSALFLAHQLDASGRFVYGFDLFSNTELDTYSTGAHSAAISALLRAFSHTKNAYLRDKAELAIDYLVDYIVTDNAHPDRAYTIDSDATVLDLSATSLAAIAISDYQSITGDTDHADLLRALANGIESMYVGSDCDFYTHQFDLEFTPQPNSGGRYYEAQATYALARAAAVLKDDTLHPIVARNLDRMATVAAYAADAPHWLALAIESYQELAGPEAASTYAIPPASIPSVTDIYQVFAEPWVAMYATDPGKSLHAFFDSSYQTTIALSQSHLTSLLSHVK